MKKRVHVLYANAGGGHYAPAKALKAQIEADSNEQVEVILVDVGQALQSYLNVTERYLVGFIEYLYNKFIMEKGHYFLSTYFTKMNVFLSRIKMTARVEVVGEFIDDLQTDMVISVLPFVNEIFSLAQKRHHPNLTFLTVLTDLGEPVPRYWFSDRDQLVFVGSKRARQQAIEYGLKEEQVNQMAGMVIDPKFYQMRQKDLASLRLKHNVDANKLTFLFMGGATAANSVLETIKAIDNCKLEDIQIICMCGYNTGLVDDLKNLRSTIKINIVPFTNDVQEYMALSDVFVGKPGTNSLMEAVNSGLLVITPLNERVMHQERYNARWLVENNLGISYDGGAQLVSMICDLCDRSGLKSFNNIKAGLSSFENKAVFEVSSWVVTELHLSDSLFSETSPTIQAAFFSEELAKETVA